jgi:hypothetical protein
VSWSYYGRNEGLIQQSDCTNVGAGSAWPLITAFPHSFTNNRLGRGHHNTKQVRKPKLSEKLLAFTTLMRQISHPTCLHFAPDVNRAVCGSPHKESQGSCSHPRQGSRVQNSPWLVHPINHALPATWALAERFNYALGELGEQEETCGPIKFFGSVLRYSPSGYHR